jgi:D-alanyl-D-alanine carboxypeptidase/D-alanyl-D-alanine-endopeptidase (penicillin-binding protein 4)
VLAAGGVLLAAACAGRAPPAPPPPTLTSEADALVEAAEADGTLASVYVVDVATREVLYAHRPQVRLLPASTMKVVSTAAALSALGADFRFRTPVGLEGPAPRGGLFEGDVVVASSGDPSLGSWRFPDTATQCEQLADALASQGVREWRGRLRVAGGEPWLEGPLGPGWAWDDAAYAYGAAPTAFVFRENVVDLALARPAAPAAPAGAAADPGCTAPPEVRLTPPLPAVQVSVVPLPGAERAGLSCLREGAGPQGQQRVRCVWRSTPEACPQKAALRLSVDAPEALMAACVDEALGRRGIARLPGPLPPAPPAPLPPAGAPPPTPLVELVSPPLAELVRATNKESLNLYAERLGMRFARERAGAEGYAALKVALAAELSRRGVAPRDLRPVDGSGLSRHNLATARGLVQVLLTSLAEPYGEALADSLPVAGVDGTLRSRPLSAEARGRVRAKTGTLSGQRAFVGLAERPRDPAHPRVAFALLFSNVDEAPTLVPNEAFDRFAEALVSLPAR